MKTKSSSCVILFSSFSFYSHSIPWPVISSLYGRLGHDWRNRVQKNNNKSRQEMKWFYSFLFLFVSRKINWWKVLNSIIIWRLRNNKRCVAVVFLYLLFRCCMKLKYLSPSNCQFDLCNVRRSIGNRVKKRKPKLIVISQVSLRLDSFLSFSFVRIFFNFLFFELFEGQDETSSFSRRSVLSIKQIS